MKTTKFFIVAFMLCISGLAQAQTKASFERMLNKYCLEYYAKDFPGRYYVKGSLTVTNVEEDALTGNAELSGTHSYNGKISHSGVQWRATIRPVAPNKYKIKFDKWYEADRVMGITITPAHWEDGATREFTYDGF